LFGIVWQSGPGLESRFLTFSAIAIAFFPPGVATEVIAEFFPVARSVGGNQFGVFSRIRG
jgi:hypothetical protein